jgi:trehalose-6-phosphatase
MFIGDDVTDEDAFRALQDHGLGIVVMDSPRPSAAKYAINDPDEVGRFFEEALMPMLEENA